MRWKGRRQSRNVDDRRRAGGGGIGRPAKVALGGGGLVSLLLIMGLVWALGGNPLAVLQPAGTGQPGTTHPSGGGGLVTSPRAAEPTPAEDETAAFISTVLADTERVWADLFAELGRTYRPPTLVLFRDQTSSACGFASAAVGPFYCPADEKIYIDLGFYDQLADRLGAPGDFAQAYVLAHEVGHHVQHLIGTADRVHRARGRVAEREYNDLSVRLELQADFLAGVWAHHAQKRWNILEPGDIDEAIGAAAAVGDDRLQRRSRGYAVPDSFTHGTSDQRVRWFRRGFETGRLDAGDTFAAGEL